MIRRRERTGVLFQELVDHFREFDLGTRQKLAERYGAQSHMASDLADAICERSHEVVDVWHNAPLSDDAWALFEELAYDHGLLVDVGWAASDAKRELKDHGILSPVHRAGEGSVPAAFAAMIGDRLTHGPRTTLPTQLGVFEDDQLKQIARNYGLNSNQSRLKLILAITEYLATLDNIHDIGERLPDLEYLGLALMVLELGGICFWQEVVGFDLNQNPNFGSNVVALMPAADREYEKEAARVLQDYAILFREEDERGMPLAIIPEELWGGLWHLGRDWLLEWTRVAFEDLETQGAAQRVAVDSWEFHAAVKWLMCEVEAGQWSYDEGLPGHAIDRLVEISRVERTAVERLVSLAFEINALRVEDKIVVPNTTFFPVVDLPRTAFVREILSEWCMGFVASVDQSAASALGLDETWRKSCLALLERRQEFVPVWLRGGGVARETTGAGYIRGVYDVEDDQMVAEFSLVNGIAWTSKLLFLDLLSLNESGRWYPFHAICDLFQMACAVSTFAQMVHVLQEPHLQLYVPIQRASFLGDPQQSHVFEPWLERILNDLLVPLGVARVEDGRVWLETKPLRTLSPAGMISDSRTEILRVLFADPEFEFDVPESGPSLAAVAEPSENEVPIDAPMPTILSWVRGKRIVSFEGRTIKVEI